MIYKHQYFKLDTELRKVWDENGKELSLTGKGYDVLVFLCENRKATVDEVGDFLDGDSMKLPDYNVIRQHPYKINKIVGHKVIKYENPYLSIDGAVEECTEDKINEKTMYFTQKKIILLFLFYHKEYLSLILNYSLH